MMINHAANLPRVILIRCKPCSNCGRIMKNKTNKILCPNCKISIKIG